MGMQVLTKEKTHFNILIDRLVIFYRDRDSQRK